jgi:hypothetical protein
MQTIWKLLAAIDPNISINGAVKRAFCDLVFEKIEAQDAEDDQSN